MRKSRTTDLGAGLFVLLGFAAFFFLTTQTTSRGLTFGSTAHYDVTAQFDNVGDLKVGSPVTMAGVEVGRVSGIDFDSNDYKAVVRMSIETRFDKIPSDSDASIYTQGLLGGKFIGLTPGGSETYLKANDRIEFTQSALVLENLIGQFLANMGKSSKDKGADPAAPAQEGGNK